VTYKGESLIYLQPGWCCETGDAGFLEGAHNNFNDAVSHEVIARAKHSPILPQLVRASRETVGSSLARSGCRTARTASAFDCQAQYGISITA